MLSRFELLQGAVSYLLLSGAQHRASSRPLRPSIGADRSRTAVDAPFAPFAHGSRDNSPRGIYGALSRGSPAGGLAIATMIIRNSFGMAQLRLIVLDARFVVSGRVGFTKFHARIHRSVISVVGYRV